MGTVQRQSDLGSEYRLSNALGRGAAIDSIIKVLGLWEYPEYRPPSLFLKNLPPPGGSRPQALTTSSQAMGGSRPHALLCNIYHHPQPPSKCKGYYRICQEVYFGRCPCITSLNILYKIYERKNIKHGSRLENSWRLK